MECHAEVLRSTLQLFSFLPNYQLSVFTTQEIFAETGLSNKEKQTFRIILKNNNESEKQFIRRNLSEINTNDYLLINTLQRKFHIYNNLLFTVPIALRIHNVNFYWSNIFQLKKYKTKEYKLIIKEFYYKEYKHRKEFLSKINYLLFPTLPLLEYAIQNYVIPSEKAIHFPFIYQDKTEQSVTNQKEKTIVIPGKVDTNRKDFNTIIHFVKQLVSQEDLPSTNLVFLGITEGKLNKKFIRHIHKIASNKLQITSFDSLVTSEEYEKFMQAADLVICPIHAHTSFQLSKEKYGQTKVSGGVNDAIQHKKMCFVPEEYSIENELNNIIQTYKTTEDLVVKTINYLHQDTTNTQLSSDSIYTKEKQLKILQTLFK